MKDVGNSAMSSSESSLIIEDGNAVFHYLKEVPDILNKYASRS